MAIVDDAKEVLHRIKVKLYPNYLHVGGEYMARTNNEKTLTVEEVCASMKNRGGYQGDYQSAVETVKHYFKEAVYQILDGFAINFDGFFSAHPNIGGTFNSEKDIHDHNKHPVDVRVHSLARLRKLLQEITVEVEGIADVQGYIAEFINVRTGAVNETLSSLGQFTIHGSKIRVAGEHADCGVYFECVEEPGRRIKVEEHLAENKATKIIGMAPALETNKTYRVVIVTQFTNSSNHLKEPRTITGGFTLSVE